MRMRQSFRQGWIIGLIRSFDPTSVYTSHRHLEGLFWVIYGSSSQSSIYSDLLTDSANGCVGTKGLKRQVANSDKRWILLGMSLKPNLRQKYSDSIGSHSRSTTNTPCAFRWQKTRSINSRPYPLFLYPGFISTINICAVASKSRSQVANPTGIPLRRIAAESPLLKRAWITFQLQ